MTLKYKLHRFFNFEPDNLSSIIYLAANEDLKKLAVLRKSLYKDQSNEFPQTSLEIWNYENNTFFIEQRIFDNFKQPQLAEAVDWGKDNRLFTIGLNEKLNEIDLLRGCIKKSYLIHSGPAYCMKFNKLKNLLAIGTDHGYICVFNICTEVSNEVTLEKSLKISSKVFSIDWYENNEETLLVVSTTEQIRIFNYTTGVQKDVIYFDSKECHIWSICVMPIINEFVIISGDSNGFISFWDGNTCTQIISIKLHDNDVSSVCCKNEKRAFSIGIDGRLCKFSYINGKVIVQGNQQYVSEYELKSIVSSEYANCLFLGGVDTELKKADPTSQFKKIYTHDFERLIKSYKNFLMYQNYKNLKIWKIENDNQPQYIGTVLSKNEIITSAINKNYVVYSDFLKTIILKKEGKKFIKLGCIKNSKIGSNIQQVTLIDNYVYLQNSVSISIYEISDEEIKCLNQLKFKTRIFKTMISKSYVVIIFDNNLFEFYNSELNLNICNLKTNSKPLICNWQTDSILWFLSNNVYVIYDINNKKTLRSDDLKEILGKEFNWKTNIEGLTFTSQSTIIYTKNKIWSINNETNEINCISNYDNICKLEKVNEQEFYMVEHKSDDIVKYLPSRVFRKKFGVN